MTSTYPELNNKEWLEEKYWEEGLSTPDIAKFVGCATSTVKSNMERLGVKLRSSNKAAELMHKKKKEAYSGSKYPELNNKEWLKEKYWGEKLTQKEIAELIGCQRRTVTKAMKRLDIPTKKGGVKNKSSYSKLNNKEWLEKKYWSEELGAREIGNLLGCTKGAILCAMDRHNIDRRSRSEAKTIYKELADKEWLEKRYIKEGLCSKDIADEIGCTQNNVNHVLRKFGLNQGKRSSYKRLNNKEWLEKKYWKEELSTPDIAELIGCGVSTIKFNMERLGIKLRSLSEAAELARKKKRDSYDFLYGFEHDELNDYNWLYNKYKIQKKSSLKIAEELGCSKSTVLNALDQHGIEKRTISENTILQLQRQDRKEFCSNISQEFCWALYKELGKQDMLDLKTKVYFQELNHEYRLTGDKSYLFDFTLISDKKYAIEFQGNHWHANPDEYGAEDKIVGKKTAQDMWRKDKKKRKIAEENGFLLKEVWEKEWKTAPKAAIFSCIAFLNRVQ